MPGTFYCSDGITVLHFHFYIVKIIMPETFYCPDVVIVLHFHDDIVQICRECFTVLTLVLSFISILILPRYAGNVLLIRCYYCPFVSMLILSRYAGNVLLFRRYYCPSFPFLYCQDNYA